MGVVSTPGEMVGNTKESTKMIGSMALVLILGLMADSTSDSGRMESSMEKEDTSKPMEKRSKAYGKMANALDG